MSLEDRIVTFALGCALGFVLGYIVRSLRDIKEELDEVDAIVKNRKRDERGSIRAPKVTELSLLIVVLIVAWSAFASQKASNDVKDNQASQARVSYCAVKFQLKTNKALNERTTYVGAQANTNVELQRAQQDFLSLLIHKPPYSEGKRYRAAKSYVTTLKRFVSLNEKTKQKVEDYPYPTAEELRRCLERK